MFFDHLGFDVTDFNRSKGFYDQALQPLQIAVVMGGDGYAGYGKPDKPSFWIAEGSRKSGGLHVAFAAETRAAVDAFYAAALAAGGKDNGPPGDRVCLVRRRLRSPISRLSDESLCPRRGGHA